MAKEWVTTVGTRSPKIMSGQFVWKITLHSIHQDYFLLCEKTLILKSTNAVKKHKKICSIVSSYKRSIMYLQSPLTKKTLCCHYEEETCALACL